MVDFKTKIFVAVDVIFRNGFVFLQNQKGYVLSRKFQSLILLVTVCFLFTVIKLLPYFFYITFHRS